MVDLIFTLTFDTAIIITKRNSGRSKGYGFVTFSDREAASTAVKTMDRQVSAK